MDESKKMMRRRRFLPTWIGLISAMVLVSGCMEIEEDEFYRNDPSPQVQTTSKDTPNTKHDDKPANSQPEPSKDDNVTDATSEDKTPDTLPESSNDEPTDETHSTLPETTKRDDNTPTTSQPEPSKNDDKPTTLPESSNDEPTDKTDATPPETVKKDDDKPTTSQPEPSKDDDKPTTLPESTNDEPTDKTDATPPKTTNGDNNTSTTSQPEPSKDNNETNTTSEDTTPPTITLKGDNPQTIELGQAYQELGADVDDDTDNNLTLTIDSSQVNIRALGEYEVIYRAKDRSGNETTAIRTIIVKKITPMATTQEVIEYRSQGKNLLANGSFELGLGVEPFYIGWSPENARKDLTPPPLPTIDNSTSAYGERSLKFTIPNKEKYFYIDFKPPYIAESGRYDIHMGVSAKTNCPNSIRLDLYTKASQAIQSQDWKRYTFHVETDKPAYPMYRLRLLNESNDNRSCDVWLDGITWSLDEKDRDSFVRSDIVEAVFTPTPNRIGMHFRKNDVVLKANIDANQSKKVVAELHIRDLTRDGADRVYQKREIALQADTVFPYEINLGKLKHGAYMAHLVFIDKKNKQIIGEAREKFTVMRDLTQVAPPVDFVVGMHGGLSGFTSKKTFDYRGYWSLDEYYKEAYQIGIRAQRMIVGANIIPYEDGKIDFSLEAPAIHSASRNGCTTLLAINPCFWLSIHLEMSPKGINHPIAKGIGSSKMRID